MKPSFALTLSQDSIGLLHRTPSGWLALGSVRFDDPDLTDRLAELRYAALELEPGGFTTKLVIPNSEILYDTLRAPGPKAAERRAQIASQLEGRTPYGLDELVYDWSGTGEEVQVAVVARDTLAEAEGFASEHGFNPVSFVAIPEPGAYGAEPWFGLSAAAPGLVPAGEKVVRDQDPIRIAQRAGRAATRGAAVVEPVAEATAEPVAMPDPQPDAEAAPAQTEAGGALADATVAAEVTIAAEVTEDPAAGAVGDSLAASAETALETALAEEPEPAPATEPEPEPTAELLPDFDTIPEPFWRKPEVTADPEPAATSAVAGTVDTPVQSEPEPAAAGPNVDAATPASDAAEDDGSLDEAPSAPVVGTKDGGLTLDWQDDSPEIDAAKVALAASLAPAPDPVQAALVAGLRRDDLLDDDDIPPMPGTLRGATALRGRGTAPDLPAAGQPLSEKVQKALGKAAKTAKGKQKRPAERPALAPPPPALPAASGKPRVPQPANEAEAMTVFGQRRDRVGGKPRYLGLALTGLLLLLLLLIAVWAANFLEPQPRAQSPAANPPALVTPAEDPASAALGSEDEDPTLFLDEGVPLEAGPDSPDAAPPQEAGPGMPAPVTPGLAPAGAGGQTQADAGRALLHRPVEELTLPLPDAALDTSRRAALAAASASNVDLAPGASPVLQEFGALYQFDDQGRILPTPEGVVTPDGVRLVAARPQIVPPPRPGAAVAPAVDPAPVAAVPPAAAETPAPVVADVAPVPAPAMPPQPDPGPGSIVVLPPPGATPLPAADGDAIAEFRPDANAPANRPRLRPAEAAPPAPPAASPPADEGALPPEAEGEASPNAFATRRPPARPAGVTRAAEAEQARQLAAAAAAAAAAASAQQQATASLALAPTRRPAARPANFARRVETTLAAAAVAQPRVVAAAATPTPAPTRRATPDPDDDGEPEVTRAAPSIPTRASVARQATVNGALNLGRMNLIGVFGTSNSRHALVRESGGRLVRVKVGDRIDGGRVTAIGAADLSYQKGNNTHRLQMPRS